MATPNNNLRYYRHHLRVWLEEAEQDPAEVQLNNILTTLFQWMRAGRIIRIEDGPSTGRMVLEFDVVTTCPPHELGHAKVHMLVTESEEIEPPGS